jgi:hypothetical protein
MQTTKGPRGKAKTYFRGLGEGLVGAVDMARERERSRNTGTMRY